ncbi:MAG: DUF5050 domain-containing protein [Bacillota bacterium]|nr:DUF5050 domain-containing protein [Bacillota bacterium]
MQKIILILICTLSFSLFGCSKNNNSQVNNISTASTKSGSTNSSSQADTNTLNEGEWKGNDIVEDDNFIYYSNKDGIRKIDKKTGSDKLISKQKEVYELALSGEYIYFLSGQEDNIGVFRIDKEGKKFSKMFDGNMVPYPNQIKKLKVVNDKIYISSAMVVYSFDIPSGQFKLVNNDADEYDIHNDYMYYIDHGQRTFTIYKENLADMKTEIVLGKGLSMPQSDIYDNFLFIGDDLYYTTRYPYGLFRYDNGKSIPITNNDGKMIEELIAYKGNVYYITFGDNNVEKLMRYCPKDNTISQVVELKNYSNYIRIVNGYVYYSTESHKKIRTKMNEK